MFRREYHCFVAGLPELHFDEGKITSGLLDFREELRKELVPSDFRQVRMLFFPFDNANLLQFTKGITDGFDPLGNYSPEDFLGQVNNIDAIIPQPDLLEPYMVSFINRWKAENSDIAGANFEIILASGYYQECLRNAKGFLKEWLQFDLNLRNIVTAVTCRKHQIDLAGQLVGEGLVVKHLSANSSRDFGLATELDYIERIIQICEISDLMEREKKFDLFRWEFIDNKTFFNFFDIDKILGYLLKLTIALRWARLDKTGGEQVFRDLLSSMEKSYEFPDEFNSKK